MTHLCVPIFVKNTAQALRDIAAAAEAGADLVELRLDPIEDPRDIAGLVAQSILPAIVTCRPTWEGGFSNWDDAERLTFLEMCVVDGAKYIDIELKTAEKHESVYRKLMGDDEKRAARIILSSHDFTGRPARLYNILEQFGAFPADINKIVWTARSIRDNIESLELQLHRQRPTIALCMGEAGFISRVLTKKFGGFLTFAPLSVESATAGGQIPIADMKRLYRWDAIGPATKVYGVVAKPVVHSMSPAIHNAAFTETSHDGVYLPMLVETGYESFKAFMESFLGFSQLDLAGLSVTIPHKENALKYLREKGAWIEELAQRIGAVNTIRIEKGSNGPTLRGWNTDYAAIVDSIAMKLGIARQDLAKLRISVIGAGGTGRTAVAALAHFGADVAVCNRTLQRAEELSQEFSGKSGPVRASSLEEICNASADVVINTTSVGMHPNVNESPAPNLKLNRGTLVFDTVYNPPKTKLLEQAETAGARTLGGIEMFVRQAAAQFEIWTEKPAPTQIMRRVLEDRLAR